MGGRYKNSIKVINPGPGQYNDVSGAYKKKQPENKFGTSSRTNLENEKRKDEPGPGNYSHVSDTV
jgi:hypothetical protein